MLFWRIALVSILTAAQEVFQRTAQLVNEKVKNGSSEKRLLKEHYSIQDVQDVVLEAKRMYETRSEQSKVRKWLSSFSSRFMYYSEVMDMLAQHHPEYVSLAWGTVKCLFVLVLNHEELIVQLSKAMSKIADVLPRVDFQIELYRTDLMVRHVEDLYVEIIAFFDRASKWYRDGKVMHMLKSFTNPYSLRFKDLVDRIDERTRRIDSLAATLAQAELKQMHVLLASSKKSQEETHKLLVEVKQIMITNHAVTSSRLIDTYESTRQIQFAQMIDVASRNALPEPLQSLRYYQSMRKRRQAQSTIDFKHVTTPLQDWATSKESSLLLIQGSLPTRLMVQDLVADIIELVKSANVAIAWALKADNALEPSERPIHVIKHLVMQILQHNSSAVSRISADFNAAMLQSARTEADWFGILKIALSGLSKTFLVLHMDALGPLGGDLTWLTGFCQLLVNFIKDNKDIVLKVAIVNYRPLLLASYFPVECLSLRMEKWKGQGMQKRGRNTRGKHSRHQTLQRAFIK